MKEKFNKPLIEVVKIDNDEIITTSHFSDEGESESDIDW